LSSGSTLILTASKTSFLQQHLQKITGTLTIFFTNATTYKIYLSVLSQETGTAENNEEIGLADDILVIPEK